MALGSPGVPIVRQPDARSIEGGFAAVRVRLAAIESLLTQTSQQAVQGSSTSSQSANTLVALQLAVQQLQAQVAALIANASGPTITYRADAVVTFGDPVFVTSVGGVSPVDTQDPTAIFAVIGVATSNAAIGSNIVVRLSGLLTVGGAAFEAGRAVYAEIGSGLTQFPNYAAVAIPVGVAISATAMEVKTAWPTLLDEPFYPGGYEQFMPVALRVVQDALDFTESFDSQANGVVVKSAADQVTTRTLTGTVNRLSVTDGDGVGGAPTFDIDGAYVGQTSITTLGTVTTGTWQGSAVGPAYGGTGLSAYATGDLVYASAVNTLSGLPIGSSGYVLTVSGGVPVWAAPSAGSGTVTSVAATVPAFLSIAGSPITTSGTLAITYSGTALPETSGGTGNITYVVGDLLYCAVTNTLSKRTIGATGNVLTVSGGVPVWAPPATSGTVTSVAATVPAFLSIAGSPITTSGTLTISYSGTALPEVNGGTGNVTYTTGDLIYASAANTLSKRAIGSTGNILTVVGGIPTWTAPAAVGANPTAAVGLTAVNGSATTFMRSDAAPAIDQAVAPTWTGSHRWSQPLGINIAASAWGFAAGSGGALDISTTGAITSVAGVVGVGTESVRNAYFDGTDWRYKNTSAASRIRQTGGVLDFLTSPSGTAGTVATFTSVVNVSLLGVIGCANKVYPGTDAAAMQTVCGLFAGTGAPNNANGTNGDIYFNAAGGALTTIYQRRAGVWVGIV